jgi:pimeloyl-ACP methyl ester carboxylesterase
MRKIVKNTGTTIIVIIGTLSIIVLVSFINHKIKLNQESKLFKPLGTMVTVNEHLMHVYSEGRGDFTLVFMSGGGTSSPTLDFKSLYSRLSNDYRVAVIEKAGYGFSEIVDIPRDIDTVLEETRKALTLAGEKAPYVLFPHSMSGIEALYWARKYPDEIAAIVGLDPAVPHAYENYPMPNKVVLNLAAFAAKSGITRLVPSICNNSAAIQYGSLTDGEKEIYKAIFYRRTATRTMLRELENIQESAKKVNEMGSPRVPMLFFISNGDGTGWEKEQWQKYSTEYISRVPGGQQVLLDCGHYIHDYEYETIASQSKDFLNNIIQAERAN